MTIQLLGLPGTVVHETAHGLVVLMLPGVSIDEIDITSHVSYSGAITVPRAVLVSYVPLLVLSGSVYTALVWTAVMPFV